MLRRLQDLRARRVAYLHLWATTLALQPRLQVLLVALVHNNLRLRRPRLLHQPPVRSVSAEARLLSLLYRRVRPPQLRSVPRLRQASLHLHLKSLLAWLSLPLHLKLPWPHPPNPAYYLLVASLQVSARVRNPLSIVPVLLSRWIRARTVSQALLKPPQAPPHTDLLTVPSSAKVLQA